jgi:predicted metal-dependent hydrolase
VDADVACGIELFAAGRYHAAHGAFERAWVRRGRDAPAIQGLIQVAAACVHLDRERLRPAERLLRRAREKLCEDPSAPLRVRLDDLLASMDACLAVIGGDGEGHVRGRIPRTAYPKMASSRP